MLHSPIKCRSCGYKTDYVTSDGDTLVCMNPRIVNEHKKDCYCMDNSLSFVEIQHAAGLHMKHCDCAPVVIKGSHNKDCIEKMIDKTIDRIREFLPPEEKEIEELRRKCTITRPHISEKTWTSFCAALNERNRYAVWFPVYAGDKCIGIKKVERNN